MKSSRSQYVLKNVSVTLLMQVAKNLLAFISRTIFVYILGAEYLGVNSLFTDILTVLSFAELGIGNAMIFSLYKPLADKDNEKIKSLMKLYAKAYRIIGVVIAVLGVCLVPFIKYIVGDVSYVKENIIILYLLFLFNSVISYFFVCKKSLIIADQQNYIVDIYQQIFYTFQVIAQSIFLIITKQFIQYLLIAAATTFLNNVYVARKADRMYPYLKDKKVKSLGNEEVKRIIANVKALVVYKVGGIILESTDSMFISTLINVMTVGLYANYKMIINVFKTIGNQVMNSIVASVGNLNADGDERTKEKVFYEMLYICIWFFGFATVGLCCFLTPLLKVWLGSDYVIGFDSVVAACVYFFVSSMHYPCYIYRTTAGLFVFGKYIPIIAASCNIVLDIILGKMFGLAGILWASTISRVITYEIVDPLIIYKKVFHKSVARYYGTYVIMILLVLADGLISHKIASIIALSGFVGVTARVIVFSIIFNCLFFVVTFRTSQFKSIYERIKIIINARKKQQL